MKKERWNGLKKDIQIMLYFLKLATEISNTYIPILFISSVFKAATPFINIIMPKFIIDELLGQQRKDVFIFLVSVTILGNGILNLINRWFDTLVSIKNNEIVNGFDLLIGEKIMAMDFEKIEDPEVLDLKERALFPLKNQGVLWRMINNIVNAITQCITIIGLVAVISTLNIFVVILIISIVLLNSLIYKKSQAVQYKFHEGLTPINRAFGYYVMMTSDFSIGKDVRLYNISPLIMGRIEHYNEETLEGFGGLFKVMGQYEGLNKINVAIQMAVVYAYMTYRVFIDGIGIGDFTMYVNAANNFSNSIAAFFNTYIEIRQMCRYLDPYLEFEQIASSREGNHRRIDNKSGKWIVEFKNVSFKYPRSKEYTLKNISITINSGEKLSVVGLNGAGKTTFIKLLTRLYEPTEGEILLNGVDIREYDYDEYMQLFSVVFQDFKLMAFSIKENIALEDYDEVDDEEIFEVLEKAGLKKDISKFSKGIHTSIYKSFDKNGIELSGGQSQKLAIARAIYKDAPIVILDEPTAALDPLAEYEIYSRFNELVGDKTTIYISHRLSSCRFCDKVAVFHEGEIIQHGTHDELIKDEGQQYETMYRAQAQYYVQA